ncbi:MAG: hypothetical protein IPK82_17755 [Polyangiaceae bacterium]|nr:hypothetical protein [Polyangiaceae bacterium]
MVRLGLPMVRFGSTHGKIWVYPWQGSGLPTVRFKSTHGKVRVAHGKIQVYRW